MTKSRKAKQPKITAVDGLPLGRKKRVAALYAWIVKRGRLLTYLIGTAVVILWTVLRHITNGVNFDVVGQIGVAQQWAHGQHAGVQFGATNYFLKLPLYFLVNHVSFLSPMARILTLAIICNVATYLLIFWLFEHITRLYKVKRNGWLNIGMLWLATIAGKVFWVDYANSRNLETAGGVLLLYLTLRYYKLQQRTTLVWLTFAALLVFFADPLQLYVVGAGIGFAAIIRALYRRTKQSVVNVVALLVCFAIGFAGSKALDQLTSQYLKVSYLAAPLKHFTYNWPALKQTLESVGINTLTIFDADIFHHPIGFNTLRSGLNLLILMGLSVLVIRAYKKTPAKLPYLIVGAIIAVNYAVYIVTGQALGWQTSRYLLMVPLIGLALLTIVTTPSPKLRKRWLRGQYLAVIACLASAVLLGGALAISWPSRHSKDAPIYDNLAFMQEYGYTYGLSTRETGITVSYFSQGRVTILPMLCDASHDLTFSNLFYDQGALNELAGHNEDLPILVPPDGIRTNNDVCSVTDIMNQFGVPKRQLGSPTVGTALIYTGTTIQLELSNARQPVTANRGSKVIPHTQAAASLPRLNGCKQGTVDVIVAHPDDDLLFMNPSLSSQFVDKCIRTVYVTAADDGHPEPYWLNRENGVKAAYAAMAGVANNWSSTTITVRSHLITAASLLGRPSISLLFVRLPDGNVTGRGFERTGNVALARAAQNPKLQLHTLDRSSTYTYAQLVDTVAAIIANDRPAAIYTHISTGVLSNGDHSDHRAVGRIVLLAQTQASNKAPVDQFVGYPSNNLPPNLSTQQAVEKRQIFYDYANDDGMICLSADRCSIEDTYGRYFSRSYEIKTQTTSPQALGHRHQTKHAPETFALGDLVLSSHYL